MPPLTRSNRLYIAITTTFCVVLILSNIITVKIFRFGGLALPAGLITYPITFLLTDLITEIWGTKHAKFSVLLAFAMSLLMTSVIYLAICLPSHDCWVVPGNRYGYHDVASYQLAFESVFSVNGKLVFGSMAAYLTSQLVDVTLFDKIRTWSGGRFLWLRNNVSTLVSQLIDTAVIGSIYLYWALGFDFYTGLSIMAASYAYKAVFALCDTPFLYLAVRGARRILSQEKELT